MQVYRASQGAPCWHEDAAVVAPCEQVVVCKELNLGHSLHFILQPLHLPALYTKRWFRNHCPVHVTRVIVSGSHVCAFSVHL